MHQACWLFTDKGYTQISSQQKFHLLVGIGVRLLRVRLLLWSLVVWWMLVILHHPVGELQRVFGRENWHII